MSRRDDEARDFAAMVAIAVYAEREWRVAGRKVTPAERVRAFGDTGLRETIETENGEGLHRVTMAPDHAAVGPPSPGFKIPPAPSCASEQRMNAADIDGKRQCIACNHVPPRSRSNTCTFCGATGNWRPVSAAWIASKHAPSGHKGGTA